MSSSTLDTLRIAVCRANQELSRRGLVIYSWGNVSGIDRVGGTIIIKPSGVAFDELTPKAMVPVRLSDGKVLDGDLQPSSDTPTHLEIYRHFADIGGVCHSHSPAATAWAQARQAIPALGTTHADAFYGEIPVTDDLTDQQIASDYEINTGKSIIRRFADLDPAAVPAVLAAGHGPFTWGASCDAAVEHAVICEQVASIARDTVLLNHALSHHAPMPIAQALLNKHYTRKHGKNAYYGQTPGEK